MVPLTRGMWSSSTDELNVRRHANPKWILTGCDINKDITVTDMLQLSAINIQLKDADRVFRIYIKSLGDKAVYRVEESVRMRSSLVNILRTIRSPSEPQNIE